MLSFFSNTSIKQNLLYFYPMCFFLFFNSFTLYSFSTNTITNTFNEKTILYTVAVFEGYNLLVDGYYNSKKWLFLYHHISAIIIPAVCLLTYEKDVGYINAVVQLFSINLYSNLFLCLQSYYTKAFVFNLIFISVFVYCRLYVMYPYVIQSVSGKYVDVDLDVEKENTNMYYASWLVTNCIVQLYCLNIYWSVLIIKKYMAY